MVVFMDSIQNMNCNIFFLFKILSEIKPKDKGIDSTIDRFCDKIRHHMFSENKIILCVAYSSDYNYSKADLMDEMELTQQIVAAFESKGYECLDAPLPDSIFELNGTEIQKNLTTEPRTKRVERDGREGNQFPLIVFNNDNKCGGIDGQFALPDYIKRYIGIPRDFAVNCSHFDNRIEAHSEPVPDNRDCCYYFRIKRDDAQCSDCNIRNPMESVKSLCFQVLTQSRK